MPEFIVHYENNVCRICVFDDWKMTVKGPAFQNRFDAHVLVMYLNFMDNINFDEITTSDDIVALIDIVKKRIAKREVKGND